MQSGVGDKTHCESLKCGKTYHHIVYVSLFLFEIIYL